jgi:hypothetical protein
MPTVEVVKIFVVVTQDHSGNREKNGATTLSIITPTTMAQHLA